MQVGARRQAMTRAMRPAMFSASRQFGGFSPLPLFAAGEQGGWWDPSDFSTMFQDSAGTTPVTAVGQPVGLKLDKRLGAVPGSVELITNGTFSSGTTAGWTAEGAGVLTVENGRMKVTRAAVAGDRARQDIATTVGEWYVLEFEGQNDGPTWPTCSIAGVTYFNSTVPAPTTRRCYFQATAATTPVVFGVGNGTSGSAYVDNISVRTLRGNHRAQPTSTSRTTLQVDANGFFYWAYDGTDDWDQTASVDFTGTDKMTVIAGVQKTSDAAVGILCELNATASAGSFSMLAPAGAGSASFGFRTVGSSADANTATGAGFAAPIAAVVTGQGSIADDLRVIRVNGVQAATNSADQGAGNLLNAPIYFGRRGGTTLPFNGREYGTIIRGAATDAALLSRAERFIASRMGITL